MAGQPLRIANCSGFYGDRLAAAREMVDGGPIDVLSGDWLAELTMLILARNRLRDPGAGYARTFVTQMEQVMGTCLDRGIKVVTNAGGLNPAGCADAVAAVADALGLSPAIAYVEGDDLMGRLAELRAAGHDLAHLDTGEALGDREVLTANAYVGGWGIANALSRGADIVITGRTTDAALAVGPAAWRHGWARDDWDALAGAVVAGHVIECGAQATGGNYSFFTEVAGLEHPGFPIAEIAADGSSVITKHEGTGGAVTIGTVTAQLLYEIGGPAYLNPDVIARFDTIALAGAGPDRVAISGVRGEPPPPTSKVCINYVGGHRTTMTLALTGLDIEEKAALVERTLWAGIPGGKEAFAEVDVQLLRTDHDDPGSNEQAVAQLRITVKDPDERKVGRALSGQITEMALASYPGFFGLGGGQAGGSTYGVYWPALIPSDLVWQEVVLNSTRTVVESTPPSSNARVGVESKENTDSTPTHGFGGGTERAPIGRVVGARSGDKGGNANLGVWARTDDGYAWLDGFLTTERLRELLVETRDLDVERYALPNIRAINFVIKGLLGEGVASSTRVDGQAKGLGEYLRAKVVDVPHSLLDAADG
ncbi:MAG TPA: acyclic terpene utilization AtuA family protein [Acidimicrobiales bacterium]|nr:acyclic terpene utilization AtuA family protein [Acidimicrobiales bacterium]